MSHRDYYYKGFLSCFGVSLGFDLMAYQIYQELVVVMKGEGTRVLNYNNW